MSHDGYYSSEHYKSIRKNPKTIRHQRFDPTIKVVSDVDRAILYGKLEEIEDQNKKKIAKLESKIDKKFTKLESKINELMDMIKYMPGSKEMLLAQLDAEKKGKQIQQS